MVWQGRGMGSGQWLERYKEGERALVWHELRQAGDGVREPEFAQDAQAVCDEMARRAGHNIEMVVARCALRGTAFTSTTTSVPRRLAYRAAPGRDPGAFSPAGYPPSSASSSQTNDPFQPWG